MDILITENTLRKHLQTDASLQEITNALCESGPTVDRIHKLENDNLLEIEVITNRVDCASVFGVAREANAILEQKNITSQILLDPYKVTPPTNHQTQKINLNLTNKDYTKRFLAVSIDGVNITESEQETKDLLTKIEQRPINNLVDLTNVETYLYGMPSHIFDKDKLSLHELVLREASEGETMTLLDDTKINLQTGDLIIEDGNKNIVDLCGVMGGRFAQVDEHTKNILLIVPVYDPQKIRRSSLFHQKRTLAAQIFEKSPDPDLAPHILSSLTNKVIKVAGGHISSAVLDINNEETTNKTINLDLNWLTKFVGKQILAKEACKILENLGFACKTNNDTELLVSVPSFRIDDINDKEDLAEEVTRIYGYQNITPKFPTLTSTPKITESLFGLERKIRNILSTRSYNEVINNSLISKKQIENCGLDTDTHLVLKNALSEDLSYMRTSLTSSAIQNHTNNKGFAKTDLNFFELGNIYLATEDKKVLEQPNLVLSTNSGLLQLKEALNTLFNYLNLTNQIGLESAKNPPKYFNKFNTLKIISGHTEIGYLGEINNTTTLNFNLDKPISVCEINLSNLDLLKPKNTYQPISIFPDVIEDINITSQETLGSVHAKIINSSELVHKVEYLSSYKDKHTFRLYFGSTERNLTQDETAQIKQQILQKFS